MLQLKTRHMQIRTLGVAVVLGTVSFAAAAEDIAAPTIAEKCFPAEGLVKFYEKMGSLKPARTDTLEAVMNAQFSRDDTAVSFPKFWSRSEGADTVFEVSAKGQVIDFHTRLKTLPKTADLCGEALSQDGKEPKIGLSIDNDVLFKNRTGPYSLAELQDGVADGKSFYKKMFGGPMALLVPKMTHLSLEYLDKSAPLNVSFSAAGQAVDTPPVEEFGKTFVIALKDIEASGADIMNVNGGAFKLMPSPSVKKMKSLGFTAEEDDAGQDNDDADKGND